MGAEGNASGTTSMNLASSKVVRTVSFPRDSVLAQSIRGSYTEEDN